MNETTLIQRACQMEQSAISALYRQHVQAIYRYIYYRVGDEPTVEDLTAKVFVRAIEGLPTYEPRGVPFVAWLYRIAQARVADYFRREQRVETVAYVSPATPTRKPEPTESPEPTETPEPTGMSAPTKAFKPTKRPKPTKSKDI
jgi:RNA polymerase sigma factor (sigma-70 family)